MTFTETQDLAIATDKLLDDLDTLVYGFFTDHPELPKHERDDLTRLLQSAVWHHLRR